MFLKAGAISLVLLLGSRLLGLARESALAATFGTSGMADVAVLMLTLPDWIVSVLASGALAYALLPAWANQSAIQVGASQRRVAVWLLVLGSVLAVVLALSRNSAIGWLAAGLPTRLQPAAAQALVWSALALPAALLASLWVTRLQHEQDFAGMYGANLVVNAVLVAVIVMLGWHAQEDVVPSLGSGLMAAMCLRLVWLSLRQTGAAATPASAAALSVPPFPFWTVWLWALLASGLPLVLPFAARSIASEAGEGALATFNYAWKLVELPLLLAIQLVATLAFPAIAAAFSQEKAALKDETAATVRGAFTMAWALACAAAAGLLVGAPALAQLLFGWGRMDQQSLARVAQWGAAAAWGLLPQALIAVAVTVLAAQARLKRAVMAYGLATAVLLVAAAWGVRDGMALMHLLNLIFTGVAAAVLVALGPSLRTWLPLRNMAAPFAALLAAAAVAGVLPVSGALGVVGGLAAAVAASAFVGLVAWGWSGEMRKALRR